MSIEFEELYQQWRMIERKFGVIAWSLGMINKEQLNECLRLQQESVDKPLLGQILLERGYMNERGIEEVLSAQKAMNSALSTQQLTPIS